MRTTAIPAHELEVGDVIPSPSGNRKYTVTSFSETSTVGMVVANVVYQHSFGFGMHKLYYKTKEKVSIEDR